jgi:hypothetical protein
METMYAAFELAAFPRGAPREPDVAHAGGAQNYRPSNRSTQVAAQLRRFYEAHNPEKLADVAKLVSVNLPPKVAPPRASQVLSLVCDLASCEVAHRTIMHDGAYCTLGTWVGATVGRGGRGGGKEVRARLRDRLPPEIQVLEHASDEAGIVALNRRLLGRYGVDLDTPAPGAPAAPPRSPPGGAAAAGPPPPPFPPVLTGHASSLPPY